MNITVYVHSKAKAMINPSTDEIDDTMFLKIVIVGEMTVSPLRHCLMD